MTGNLKKADSMTGRTLIPFLALSFGLTWGIAAILILFHDQVVATSRQVLLHERSEGVDIDLASAVDLGIDAVGPKQIADVVQ